MRTKYISSTIAVCVAVLAFTTPITSRAQNLFVVNNGDGTISEIAPGGIVTTFASGLNSPYGLAFDGSGNLFAANAGDDTISEITPDGMVTPFASGLNVPIFLVFQPVPVSEPSALALAGLCAFAIAMLRRNQTSRSCSLRFFEMLFQHR